MNAPLPAPSTLRPGLPAAVDEVVARGLAKEPAHRYGSAGELAEAILVATADLGAPSIPVRETDQDREQHPSTVKDSVPVGESSPGRTEADVPLWDSDPDRQARAALHAIVSNPDRGVAALSSAQAMATALKDLLPDMPRETKVLVAAAEMGLAEALSYHVARGMDPGTVRDKVARSFARHTGFRPAACQWAVDELAVVLGLDSARARPAG